MLSSSIVLSGFLLLANSATTSTPHLAVCNQIQKMISPASSVAYPGSPQYAADILHALETSTQNSTCSVQPGTTEDLGKILVTLADTRTPWAVKSGGHATNPGWSSTPGVQIAMTRFNTTSFDPSTKLATIGTGQIYDEVYLKLEKYNVSVPGARIAGVGVGGFTLGGGYSWLVNQIGLSSDNCVEYELVLPTGKTVIVNNSSYPDLFFGLKGGQNNFGVVTNIKIRTHVQSAVWGGLVVINDTSVPRIHQAVSDFQSRNRDPKAMVGVTYGFDPTMTGFFASLFHFYDGPLPPNGTFTEFDSIPSVSSTLGTKSLHTLVSSLNGPPSSPRGLWRSISIKSYNISLLNEVQGQLLKWGPQAFNRSAIQFVFAIEPMLSTIFQHQNGPSAYVHKPNDFFAPSVVLAQWADASQDTWFHDMLKQVNTAIVNFATSPAGGSQDVGFPDGILYPNYAAFDTPAVQLWGDNIPSLKKIVSKYDPKGLTELTGGWKF